MISFDFEYFKPSTATEAVQTYQHLQAEGKTVLYYCGGTEIITFARINKVYADAIIDIKGIAECNLFELQSNQLVIGAAVTLNKIAESNLFPLLGQTVKRIADHTSRNKITIGGNINSKKLMYREGILPLLLTDSQLKVAGTKGEKLVQIQDIFNRELQLAPEEFVVQVNIDKSCLELPFVTIKKTRQSNVDYPLVTVVALKSRQQLRIAFSGVCAFPFRSREIEDMLGDKSIQIDDRIEQVIQHLPAPIVDDIQGSAEYRKFVLKNVLHDTMAKLG